MQPSTSLTLARALFAVVGGGALLMVASSLASGASMADPVFPAGLALGALSLGAAAWVSAPGRLQALVVWLALLAVVVAIGVIMSIGLRNPSPDVIALLTIPSGVLAAAGVRIALGRIAAGPLGS